MRHTTKKYRRGNTEEGKLSREDEADVSCIVNPLARHVTAPAEFPTPYNSDLEFLSSTSLSLLTYEVDRDMASLRHRDLDNSKSKKKTEERPAKAEEESLAPDSKIVTDKNKPHTRKRRNGLTFLLGGVFGLVAAGFFAQRSDLLDLPELGELSMESLIDVLPAGFVSDARDLAVRIWKY